MRLAFLITVILLALRQGTHAFTWTSDLEDDADVFACVGDRVSFPWNYSVEDGELVEDIKWYYDAGNGSRKGIAATVEGEFFPLRTSFSDRIGHVKEAGLSLASVSGLDKGHYSVTVTVLRGSSFTAYTLKASLVIAEDPLVLENEALWARQERVAVYDTTGQLHVRLSCGKYVIAGHPPVSVEWTFPSGEKHLTSTNINGSFIINLPNPVEGGNYTCRLSSELPPVSCLPHNASVLRSSSVSVDEVKMRLSLLEAEQEILKTEKQTLQTEVKQLKEENRKLRELPGNLQQVRDYITEKDSTRVRFVAHPSGYTDLQADRQPIIFSNVTLNEGDAYDATTGVFTAPFNGTYFFIVSLYQSTDALDVYLSDDVNTFCAMKVSTTLKITCEANVYRSQGENVSCYVNYNYNRQVYFSPVYSSFIGFSLDLDIPIET